MYYKSLTDFIYIRLSVLIWVRNGLISISDLTKDAGDLLNDIYSNVEKEKALIIDCRGVSNLIDHSWDIFFKSICEIKRKVIFTNYTQLEEKIYSAHREFCRNVHIEKDDPLAIIIVKDGSAYNERTKDSLNEFLRASFSRTILSSFSKHKDGKPKILSSTPFYANGEYNASKILSNQYDFIYTSIFFSDFIQDIIQEEKIGRTNKPLRLLSVSLRSTPIASAVSLLLSIPLLTIEFLGPQRNPTNNHGHISGGGFEIIYLGDYSFAGTEIRITKMYASLNNCIIQHACVLGSLLPSEAFLDFKLHSVINLRENANAEYSLFKPEHSDDKV